MLELFVRPRSTKANLLLNNVIDITSSSFSMSNQTSAEDMASEKNKELDKAGNTDGESEPIMCRFESLFYREPFTYDHPHFIYFFQTPYI